MSPFKHRLKDHPKGAHTPLQIDMEPNLLGLHVHQPSYPAPLFHPSAPRVASSHSALGVRWPVRPSTGRMSFSEARWLNRGGCLSKGSLSETEQKAKVNSRESKGIHGVRQFEPIQSTKQRFHLERPSISSMLAEAPQTFGSHWAKN